MQNPLLLSALMLCALSASYGQQSHLLRARYDSQRIQNARADAENLSRIRDVPTLRKFVRLRLLSPVPASTRSYYLHGVSPSYRYLRPWSKLFLDRLSRQFHARFHRKLRVTSLIRTEHYQNGLRLRNVNAASPHGPSRSSHLTGATLDISKRHLTPSQVRWLRRVLHSLHKRSLVYAVEEFRQPTFHVMVHKDYLAYARRR
jgi:hypothetical protein